MDIRTTWFGDQFNIELASAPGKDAFLSVKGCRIVSGRNGDFISPPSTKNEKTGKYWNHAWLSEPFGAVVMEKAMASKPAQDTRTLAERKRPKDEVYRAGSPNDRSQFPDDDSSIPF